MENLLEAQESLERVQKLLVEHISVETIESVDAQFLSGIGPVMTPTAHYLFDN